MTLSEFINIGVVSQVEARGEEIWALDDAGLLFAKLPLQQAYLLLTWRRAPLRPFDVTMFGDGSSGNCTVSSSGFGAPWAPGVYRHMVEGSGLLKDSYGEGTTETTMAGESGASHA